MTKSGALIGTPAYMSPEQARGQKVDGRTDLFSLGAVLYRLCTGRLPFGGPSVMAILTSLATDEPMPVRELNPEVPTALAKLIHKLLAKKPADRPQSADEVVERIHAIEGVSPTASPLTTVPQVLYVPMDVSRQSETSAFSGLGIEDSAVSEAQLLAAPTRKKSVPWLLIGSAFGFLVCAAVAGVVIIKITNKDGTVTEIKVPDGAKIEVDGKPVVTAGTKPAAVGDADRKAALYVLSIGGSIQEDGIDKEIKADSDLPKGAFVLTQVGLHGNKKIDDDGMARFKDWHSPTIFILSDTQIGDAGVGHFKNCKILRGITLQGTQVTDTGLANFSNCKDLQGLWLGSVSDAGLAHFNGFKNLTNLCLYGDGPEVTDAGLANFKECINLTSLCISHPNVTDIGIAPFMECKDLNTVSLSCAKMTDAGMAFANRARILSVSSFRENKYQTLRWLYLPTAKRFIHLT